MLAENMASNGKAKLSKSDAETIAQGEQLVGDLDKRLRSASGKIYHSEISLGTESQQKKVDKMGSIEENMEKGGIDHADRTQEVTEPTCCNVSNQIIKLIQKLQQSVDVMDQKITASNTFQVNAEKRISDIEKKQAQEKKQVDYLNETVQQYQVKVDILSDIVSKQHQEITELKAQMVDVQARDMKCNLTFAGIPEVPNENGIQEAQKFITEKLLIKDKLIPIEQAYKFGTGRARPLLVTLRHAADKNVIFDHVKNLKGIKVNGIQCFVSTQLPEALNEKRRKNNIYMAANRKRPVGRKLPYSVKQGELCYKDKEIIPKVRTRTPRDLLRLIEPELDKINEIKLVEGVFEERNESTFRGYTTKVTSHEEINDAYKKIKLMHGKANHIACAYKLEKTKPPYDQDGCDDYEYGASKALSQAIDESGMNDVVVFMVRYYGGRS